MVVKDAIYEVAKKCTGKFATTCFTRMDLSNMKITSIDTRFGSLFSQLQELTLSRNYLAEISNLPQSIQVLNATQNLIESVVGMEKWKNLQHIGLGFNQLRDIGFLNSASETLVSVDLSFNRLVDLDDAVAILSRISNLHHLNLCGNIFALHVDYRPFVIQQCEKLFILDDVQVTEEERERVKSSQKHYTLQVTDASTFSTLCLR